MDHLLALRKASLLRVKANDIFKGCFRYKTITPQNVLSEEQIKNFFIS